MILRSSAVHTEPLLVACLCARWCNLCEEYRAVFGTIAASDRSGTRYRWIDIEDDEALLGPVDVDDFPTVLIARGDVVLFYGPLTPHPGTLARLIEQAREDGLAHLADPQLAALAARIAPATALAVGAPR